MRTFVFGLFSLLSCSLFAQDATVIPALEINKYGPGTFFSILIDIESDVVYWAPTETAVYKDGSPVEPELKVNNYGGHGAIARKHGLDLKAREVYAGGVFLDPETNKPIAKIKSISVNGHRTADDLVPPSARRWFIQRMANYTEAAITFNNETFLPLKQMTSCESVFLPMLK